MRVCDICEDVCLLSLNSVIQMTHPQPDLKPICRDIIMHDWYNETVVLWNYQSEIEIKSSFNND